jgi:hypothetical protein
MDVMSDVRGYRLAIGEGECCGIPMSLITVHKFVFVIYC